MGSAELSELSGTESRCSGMMDSGIAASEAAAAGWNPAHANGTNDGSKAAIGLRKFHRVHGPLQWHGMPMYQIRGSGMECRGAATKPDKYNHISSKKDSERRWFAYFLLKNIQNYFLNFNKF
jgi:hypothetical protein